MLQRRFFLDFTLPSLCLGTLAVAASVFACGSSASDEGGGGSSGAGGDSGAADVAVTPPPGEEKPPLGFSARMRLAGFHESKGGFVHRASKRLVSFPSAMSRTLGAITAVQLDGAKSVVTTLPLKGTPPEGSVEAMGYDTAGDRYVLLVRGVRPNRIDLATVTLGASDATVTTFAAENPPKYDGSMFDTILPGGGGTITALRFDARYTVTLAGGKATWSEPATTPTTVLPKVTTVDATRSRRVAFGADEVDRAQLKLVYRAKIFEQPFGSSAWSEISMGGSPPPDDPLGGTGGIVTPWAALDETGNRLVVVQMHENPNPPPGLPPPHLVRGMWVADLASHQWTKVSDVYNGSVGYGVGGAFAVDPDGRRAFILQGGALSAIAIGATGVGTEPPLALDGALPPRFSTAALALDGGRVAVSSGSDLLVWTGGASGRFERLASARIPNEIAANHVLARDPASKKMFLFGGSRTFSDPGSSLLHEVSADGTTITKRDLAGAPPDRALFGAANAAGTLYVVGGLPSGKKEPLADVWALDLAALSWKRVATLPEGRARPAVTVLPDGRLLVVGGYTPSGNDAAPVTSALTVDPKSGAVTTLAVDGDWPHRKGIFWSSAPFASGVFAIDSGDTVDTSDRQFWELSIDASGHARWTGYDVRTSDYAFQETVAAIGGPSAEPRAWLVGKNVWEITHY